MSFNADTWDLVDLPFGPQPTPEWARGMSVRWMDDYGNSPHLVVKTTGKEWDWPNQTWRRKNGLFYALHDDGRAMFHTHDGHISLTTMSRVKSGGMVKSEDGKTVRFEPVVMEDYQVLATTQQEGYAGRHFPIVMAEGDEFAGKTVILRGPWNSRRLPGYCEIITIAPDPARDAYDMRRGRRWYDRGGCFGICITQDLLLRLFARYLPHLRLACCKYGWSSGSPIFEPMKSEWDAPKQWMLKRQSEERNLARALA